MALWEITFENLIIEADTEDEAVDKAYEEGADVEGAYKLED